ncbi:hypothetical protein [Lachnospira sp.]|uniref:hypothetical protein n=1 Tax=Lachnospira sp. TaxID=2049031 RepID=UPI0025796E47|nr:hypothetical protein [Lachnospira sp.]
MFKLLKYEIRKNIAPLLIFFLALAFLEGYFLICYSNVDYSGLELAIVLLVFATAISYFIVFALAISSYSKELKNKTIYLIFMTPNSTISIILSKLIHAILTAFVVALVFAAIGFWDIKLYASLFDTANFSALDILDIVLVSLDTNLSTFILSIVFTIISVVIVFLTYVVMGYLSITISATILSNSKARGFLSVALFIAFVIVYAVIINHLPKLNSSPENIGEYLFSILPQIIISLISMFFMIWGTAYLLDKKISL